MSDTIDFPRHALLNREEEQELVGRLPDPAARDRLVLANVRLVVGVAKRYVGMPLEDLVQEGMAGLLIAVDRFDPARRLRLSTYATWWIRQTIRRAVAERGLIHVPETQCSDNRFLHAAERARRVVGEGSWLEGGPLDAVVGREDEPGDEVERREEAHRVRQLLATLPPREATVLRLRFGIGCPPRTLREVGAAIGLTKERARQIENEGLRWLRLKSRAS